MAIVQRITARRFGMSAFGTMRPSECDQLISAFRGKADITRREVKQR
jgi:hypothetical protein